MAIGSPTRPPVFNLPNQLTAARFVLGLVLFGLIELNWWVACIVVFALAAVTDWLDGYLARRYNLGSSLGRNLDPLVDKVLVCGAYIFLLPVHTRDGLDSGLAAWMVTIVVGRELVITGLRSFMESYGALFGADWLGKLKMGLQCAALFAIFVAFQMPEVSRDLVEPVVVIREVLIFAMLASTALSGLQYLWRAAHLLRED